jgi:hypothetical protein
MKLGQKNVHPGASLLRIPGAGGLLVGILDVVGSVIALGLLVGAQCDRPVCDGKVFAS